MEIENMYRYTMNIFSTSDLASFYHEKTGEQPIAKRTQLLCPLKIESTAMSENNFQFRLWI